MSSLSLSLATFSNDFSEATGVIEAKLQIVPPWVEGTEACSLSPGHMTGAPPRPYMVNST